MLKFAHSLSIAFGFLVACVHGLYGTERTAAQFCPQDGGQTPKICENVAADGEKIRHADRTLLGGFFAVSALPAQIAEMPAISRTEDLETVFPESRKTQTPVSEIVGCANPIRAPSAA